MTHEAVLKINGKPMTPRGKPSLIQIRAEEMMASAGSMVFTQLKCKNIRTKKGCCAPPPPEPALWIMKSMEGGREIVVVKRNGTFSKGEVNFGTLEVSIQELCNGDYHRPLIMKLMDLRN